MFLKIKIDNSSKKGKNFAQDSANSDLEDPKAGIISNGNCCTCLNTCRPGNSILKCCMCDESYHPDCIKRPLHNDVVLILKENPNCWWTCLSCLLSVQPFTNVESNNASMPLESIKEWLDRFKVSLLADVNDLLSSKLNLSSKSDPCSLITSSTERVLNTRKRAARDSHRDDASDGGTTKQRKTDLSSDSTLSAQNDLGAKNAETTFCNVICHSSTANQTLQEAQLPTDNFSTKKYVLHYKPLTDAVAFKNQEEWFKARRHLTRKLNSVQISFSKFNNKTGRVKLGFPDSDSMNKAKGLIESTENDLWCYEEYIPALLLPKLTIYNVPLDFDVPSSDHDDSNPGESAVEFRNAVKTQLLENILHKNESVKHLVENGSTVEVIYVQKHKYCCTAALKVSPDVRHHIINACQSKIYVFSSRCRVTDRYHYKQCFHCQGFGHVAGECPFKDEAPTCMYCSGNHLSRSCMHKRNRSRHTCSNCLKSSNPSISSKASSHNAGSHLCPMVAPIIESIQSKTNLALSKNLTTS